MAQGDLTPEMVFALLQSEETFPVDFDDAMAWWDCRTKKGTSVRRDNLIRKLEENFDEDDDYVTEDAVNSTTGIFPKISGKIGKGRPKGKIYLTVDCFKSFGMLVSGKRGKQIRRYFIDCEKELKRRIQVEQQDVKGRILEAFVSDSLVSRRRKNDTPRFKDEFYQLLYQKRGQGWEHRSPRNRPPCVGTWTNQVVYDRFPDGVKDRLNEVNPRVEGRRKHKHHEHLKPMGSDHLDKHIPAVMAIARLSPDGNWDKFMRNIQKGLPNGEPLQTSLLDLLEEYEQLDQAS